MDLIAKGNSNWDYYIRSTITEKVIKNTGYTQTSLYHIIFSVPKEGTGCGQSVYGNLDYFKKMYKKGHIGSLTELGEKIVLNGYIPRMDEFETIKKEKLNRQTLWGMTKKLLSL